MFFYMSTSSLHLASGFLNRLLVSQGYTLPIVPELDMLTIGGLIMGGGIESTSHKYGLFHHICIQYEVVTSDGECIIADLETNSDVFHALPFSYGTLGFLTSVTIKIVTFKPYLRLTYRPTFSLEETCKVLERETYRWDRIGILTNRVLYDSNSWVTLTTIFRYICMYTVQKFV